MSPGIKEANDLSLPELYKASLEQHIEKGGWSLVCRDEELCKRVEEMLQGQSAEESHRRLSVDVLAVMEESLRCPTTAMAGLQGLTRAFEVLELASLNLYLYPWRKEYRVIKTYSGVFTHQVKPALSVVQVEELFGLLGYRVSLGNSGEEELRLGLSRALPDDLVRLACCFFVGRSECQLLMSALEPLCPPSTLSRRAVSQGSCGRGARRSEWERRLVQERRQGHSLQVALQRVQLSLATASLSSPSPSSAAVYGNMDGCCLTEEMDEGLYLEEGAEEADEGDPAGPGVSEGVSVSLHATHHHPPPQQLQQQAPLQQHLSSGVSTTSTISPSPTSQRCVSTLSYRISSPSSPSGGARLMEEPAFQVPGSGLSPVAATAVAVAVGCTCAKYGSERNYLCHQCNMLHCVSCPVLTCCQTGGHTVNIVSSLDEQSLKQAANERSRVTRRKDKRSSPPLIWSQPIGLVERHSCLKERDEPHLTCHTCGHAHDYLCEDGQRCTKDGHQVEYRLQQSRSMPFHLCCNAASPAPQFACLCCRLFHAASCRDGDVCRLTRHTVRELRGACEFEGCSSPPHILCRHCCAQYCRECWYKSPLNCLCGKPYDTCGSSV